MKNAPTLRASPSYPILLGGIGKKADTSPQHKQTPCIIVTFLKLKLTNKITMHWTY